MERKRRCFAITGNIRNFNLSFCKRRGNWRFYCHEHRRQPLYWLFIGVIGIAAIVADFSTIKNLLWPPIVVIPTSLEVISGYEQRRSSFIVYNTSDYPYYDVWIQVSLEMNDIKRKQVVISEPDPAVNSYSFVKEGEPFIFGFSGFDKNGNDAIWVEIWDIPPHGKREYVIELQKYTKLTESSKLKARISMVSFESSPKVYVSTTPDKISSNFDNKGGTIHDIIITWKGGIPKHILENSFEIGKNYFHENKYDLAIKEFDKILEIYTGYYPAYIERANAYLRKGDYARSIKDCDQAIELKPNEYHAYLVRANAYHEKGDYVHAIADWNRVIELQPSFYIAYYMRGVDYKFIGEEERAISDFQKVLNLTDDQNTLQHTRNRLQELGQ